MVKKRTTLDTLFATAASSAETDDVAAVPTSPATATDKRRPSVKQQTVYLSIPMHEQLRRLAFEENVRMHDLLMEGLDRVFRDRGLLSVSELSEINSPLR